MQTFKKIIFKTGSTIEKPALKELLKKYIILKGLYELEEGSEQI